MPERQEREQRRRDADCPVVPPIGPVTALPPTRPLPACDPLPDTPAPDTFTRPGALPSAPSPVVNVPPVPIGNVTTTTTCADLIAIGALIGPSGDPVTVAQDSIVEEFVWLTYADLSTPQLAYLSTLPVDAMRENLLANTLEQAVDFFHLTNFQTKRAREDAQAIQARVNQQAHDAAAAAIICGWFNTQQSVACNAGALGTGDDADTSITVLNPAVTPAGTIFSVESQDAADEEALRLAESRLGCAYGNVEVSRSCSDLGFAEAVPNDAVPWPNLGRRRVGIYVVPANTFFSPGDTADANTLALLFAEAQLDCFYINNLLSLDCAAVGKTGVVAVQETTEANGRLQLGLTGNPVVIPEGWVTSNDPLLGTAAANAAANQLANALLDCHWINAEVNRRCPNEAVKDPNTGNDIVIPPSGRSPVIEVTIPAGSLESLISQADADAQALDAALSQLDCLYCNLSVLPTCIPSSVLAKVKQVIQWDVDGVTDPEVWEAAGIPDPSVYRLPLNIERLKDAGEFPETWSSDATLGAGADVYCDPNAQLAQQIGVGGIQPPISLLPGKEGCRYGNDDIRVCCGNPGNQDPNGPQQGGNGGTPLGDCAFVPKDTFQVVAADVPSDFEWTLGVGADGPNRGLNQLHAYANTLAWAMGRAMLVCLYCNALIRRFCDERKVKPLRDVHRESIGWRDCRGGPGNPVVVEECTFVSAVSQSDANAQAERAADAQLYCFYMNRKITAFCADSEDERSGGFGACDNDEPGFVGALTAPGTKTAFDGSGGGRLPVEAESIGSEANPALVEKDSFISMESQQAADEKAVVLANSMLFCFWTSNPVEALCGAQTMSMPWTDAHALSRALPLKGGNGLMDGKAVRTSPGKPGSPFVVEGGAAISVKGPKTASGMAWAIAKAGIVCCVGNDRRDVICTPTSPAAPGDSDIESGFSMSTATVPEDEFESCESLAKANSQAERVAKALLICSYTNKDVSNPCGGGQLTLGLKSVPTDTFHSSTGSSDPNASANGFIEANKECVDPDDLSGDDGRQTNCESKCLAIYS